MKLLIQHIEPLLWKYRVNLAFWGHNHAFQRQSAVYQSVPVQRARTVTHRGLRTYWYDDPQATVHLVVGTGGAQFTYDDVSPFPAWAESVFYRHGYARAHALNATHLQWNWVNAVNGTVYDHVFITQDPLVKSWFISGRNTLEYKSINNAVDFFSSLFGLFATIILIIFVATTYYSGILISGRRRMGYNSVPDAELESALKHENYVWP